MTARPVEFFTMVLLAVSIWIPVELVVNSVPKTIVWANVELPAANMYVVLAGWYWKLSTPFIAADCKLVTKPFTSTVTTGTTVVLPLVPAVTPDAGEQTSLKLHYHWQLQLRLLLGRFLLWNFD